MTQPVDDERIELEQFDDGQFILARSSISMGLDDDDEARRSLDEKQWPC